MSQIANGEQKTVSQDSNRINGKSGWYYNSAAVHVIANCVQLTVIQPSNSAKMSQIVNRSAIIGDSGW